MKLWNQTSPAKSGVLLIIVGTVILGMALGVSWATAPETTKISRTSNTSVLVGVQGPGWGGSVTALENNGSTRWSVGTGSVGKAISYQGVSYLKNGTVLATFADGPSRKCGQFDPPCKRTGVRFIDPQSEKKIGDQWSYPVRTRKDSEVHDAEMLPTGELLVADMEYESIYSYNLSTGRQTWVWNASRYYNAPPDPTKTDWLHINDVDRIGPNRYLVSVRNTNQLVIVERGKGVVEVINEDRDPTILDKQHNPHWLGDGAVLVADSENNRVVELHRNESTGQWEEVWAVYEVGGISLDWPRDADRLPNGNTLITDSRNNRVVEIARNGSVVNSYQVPALPYEADIVPYDESFGQPYQFGDTNTVLGGRSTTIPILSPLLTGIQHVIPTPFWVTELHVFAALVAIVLWVVGGILITKSWRSSL